MGLFPRYFVMTQSELLKSSKSKGPRDMRLGLKMPTVGLLMSPTCSLNRRHQWPIATGDLIVYRFLQSFQDSSIRRSGAPPLP